jgi:uncharacterized protein (TIGR03435 family)
VSGANVKNRIRDIMTNRVVAKLTVVKKAVLASVGATVLAAPILAQSVPRPSAIEPRFEVTSVKRTEGTGKMLTVRFLPGGQFEAINVTLGSLIRLAYRLQDFQAVGGPAWVNSDRFDIQARGPATETERYRRLQSLLTDRFALKVHRESRDHPIYALVRARDDGSLGPMLRRSKVGPEQINEQSRADSPPRCGLTTTGGPRRLSGCGSTIGDVASLLPMYAGRMVVDRTGLTGLFDFELRFADMLIPGAGPGGGPTFAIESAGPDAPSFFTALEEQLGLKLEAQTAPVEVLVIDHVERPTPN